MTVKDGGLFYRPPSLCDNHIAVTILGYEDRLPLGMAQVGYLIRVSMICYRSDLRHSHTSRMASL